MDSVALGKDYNEIPIRILSIKQGKRGVSAILQIIDKSGETRKITVNEYGQDLYILSNYNNIYTGYTIENIDSSMREVSFQNGIVISELTISNDEIKDKIMEMQVEQTVKSHFDKERYFKDILKIELKVLSLFFIDKVKNFCVEIILKSKFG